MGVSAYAAKRVDGQLKDYFEVLPRRRFAIIPVPDALAPFYTAGRGGLDQLPDEHLQSAGPPALQHPRR